MSKTYYRIGECVEGVNELKGKRVAGVPTEFTSFGDNITYKLGYHCIVAAAPASGKSFWVLHTCLHLADKENYKILVYSPEMGDRFEITALLVHMKSGKSIYDISGVERISDDELMACLKWLNNHFIIIDGDKNYSMQDIYDEFHAVEKELNCKLHVIIVDNLNDIKEPIDANGRQDLGVEMMLSEARRFNKKNNCYTFFVTHSASQGQPITQNGVTYYNPITPRQIRSGEAIYRKSFLLLTLWRPPFGLQDEDGRPYERNETHIIVLKGKPANTATKGFVGKIFFDANRYRFTDQPPTLRLY